VQWPGAAVRGDDRAMTRSAPTALRPRLDASEDRHGRLTRGVVLAGVLLGVAQLATHAVAYGVYDLRVRALDSGVNTSVFGWVESAALVAAIAAAAAVATRRRDARAAVLAAALLGVLVIGRLAVRDEPPAVAVTVVAAAVAFLLLLDQARGAAGDAGRLLRAAVALFVASLALHVVVPSGLELLGWYYHSWPYQVKIALKESIQTASWAFAAAGLALMAATSVRGRGGGRR
jgi:hypothetical protein